MQVSTSTKPGITPFLTFNNEAEDAINFYTAIFPNSQILSRRCSPEGTFFTGTIVLNGLTVHVLNGGPTFSFAQGFSLMVSCETQEEVDNYWEKLIADGGREQPCGWLQDKFGISWQIIPNLLSQLLNDPDREKAGRAMQAMLTMRKLDMAGLQKAFDGE